MRLNLTHDYGLVRQGVVFDPATLMVTSMAATAASGAIGAAGTLAGGSYAAQAGAMQQQQGIAQQQAAEYQAKELEQNANQAMASGQRRSFDQQLQTKLALSSARAAGAGSGVDVGFGSPLAVQGQIGQRGSYLALMDMFNGESEATGLKNEATAVRYGGAIDKYAGDVAALEGEEKRNLSDLSAFGTLAGSAGSMAQMYGAYAYPSQFGRPRIGL